MQTELINPAASGLANSDRIARLVADFLAGRKATTLATYAQGLADFARFIGARSIERGRSAAPVAISHGEANHLVLTYRADMVTRGLAANTVNDG